MTSFFKAILVVKTNPNNNMSYNANVILKQNLQLQAM